jgi:hypothetical protein
MLRLSNRDEQRKPDDKELFFSTLKISVINWSFVFLAQHEDPEDTSIAEQLSIGKTKTENNSEKSGMQKREKTAREKCEKYNLSGLARRSRNRPCKATE